MNFSATVPLAAEDKGKTAVRRKNFSPQSSQRGIAATKRNHPLPTLPPRGGGIGWGGLLNKILRN